MKLKPSPPSLLGSLGEAFERIRALERVRPRAGWRFDVFNGDQSEGETDHGWGYVQFDDSIDHTQGELAGLFEDVTGEGVAVYSRDPGNTKQGHVDVNPDTVLVALSSSMSIAISRSAGTISLNRSSSTVMRIDADETIHIQAGQTIVADL